MFTRIYKSAHGGWMGKSELKLGIVTEEGERTLTVTTMKRYTGDIVTTAGVAYAKGGFLTTTIFSDFNKQLIKSNGSATQKRITEQHIKALEQLEEITALVKAFYGEPVVTPLAA